MYKDEGLLINQAIHWINRLIISQPRLRLAHRSNLDNLSSALPRALTKPGIAMVLDHGSNMIWDFREI
jgi:hypothetical protein